MTLDEGKLLAKYIFELIRSAANKLVIAIVIVWLAAYFMPIGRDNTDPPWPGHSGMRLYTDSLTGCQYLGTGEALIPRMSSDSNTQLGCKGHE